MKNSTKALNEVNSILNGAGWATDYYIINISTQLSDAEKYQAMLILAEKGRLYDEDEVNEIEETEEFEPHQQEALPMTAEQVKTKHAYLVPPKQYKAIVHEHNNDTNDYEGQFEYDWYEGQNIADLLMQDKRDHVLAGLTDAFKNDLQEPFKKDRFTFGTRSHSHIGNTHIIQVYGSYIDYDNYRHWNYDYTYTVVITNK